MAPADATDTDSNACFSVVESDCNGLGGLATIETGRDRGSGGPFLS